ncbi:MAG: hypothetical protein IIU14_08070 [Ruminococcus sp.]|nr:hypothetical protein [Ruminococcus sp.]
MKKRKFLIPILLVMVTLCACACSGGKNPEAADSTGSTGTTAVSEPAPKLEIKDAKLRNEYRVKCFTENEDLGKQKKDKLGNIVVYKKAKYFGVLDKLYIDYTETDKNANEADYDYEAKTKKLYKDYNKNIRKVSDFRISDYNNGVCINEYVGKSNKVTIPETLGGKKVVKLGLRLSYDSEGNLEISSPFEEAEITELSLPASVREITKGSIENAGIENITVSEQNPYYRTENGALYTKNMECLLFIASIDVSDVFSVPEGVKAVYSGVVMDISIPESVLSFGEDVKKFSYNRMRSSDSFAEVPYQVCGMSSVSYNVSEGNKYYSSYEGALYNKNKTVLLGYPVNNQDVTFVVPSSVRIVDGGVSFGESDALKTIIFGKDIEKIYCDMLFPIIENVDPDITIKGYRGTAAEQIAKKNSYRFVALD